jgi:hypothetical protein
MRFIEKAPNIVVLLRILKTCRAERDWLFKFCVFAEICGTCRNTSRLFYDCCFLFVFMCIRHGFATRGPSLVDYANSWLPHCSLLCRYPLCQVSNCRRTWGSAVGLWVAGVRIPAGGRESSRWHIYTISRAPVSFLTVVTVDAGVDYHWQGCGARHWNIQKKSRNVSKLCQYDPIFIGKLYCYEGHVTDEALRDPMTGTT